ncbi:Cobalt-zinc-cadmium resistance protein CzcC [BD1-7 clade bacterium]|uniref:Cobalt-zinc-cadmium resistance protein CzcC n=1 Tax=BD1-7 clade bacterium TaxID=2029982 RepID=A0A5S9PMP9_9GAMM|nr:Cobalt-zinc-cadmium resistance protein CzcC [BD1-7 clade bacterium]CAA0105201.1 Cobalt-zinc-cadmium resistance protein CzcC [BD1-7 clade bacterium]
MWIKNPSVCIKITDVIKHRFISSLLCLLIAAPLSAQAQNAAPATPETNSINLAWAIKQTLLKNPTLSEYPYHFRAREADVIQADIGPQLLLDVVVDNSLGTGEKRRLDDAETTILFSQQIELGDKRQRRISLARASVNRLQADYEIVRLDTLAETTRRYYEVLRLQALQTWNSRRISKERDALDVIERRAKAGAVGQADVSKMRLQSERSIARQTVQAGELSNARLALSSMWNAQSEFDTVLGDLTTMPALPDAEQITASVNETPEFIRLRMQQQEALANLNLQTANSDPNVTIKAGVQHFQATNDVGLAFGFSMPLQVENPNRGRLAVARAELDLAMAREGFGLEQLRLSLLKILDTLDYQAQHADNLQRKLLPIANTLLSDIQHGYERGRYGVLQLVDAQNELFNVEREMIETQILIYSYLLEMERITGDSMITPLNTAGTGAQ